MSLPDEKSAIVILVPEVEPLVSRFRDRFDVSALAGMPPHLTLLFPFRRPDAIDDSLVSELVAFFAEESPFEYSLPRAARFPNVLYLEPQPKERFQRLCRRLYRAYPDTPPYGGAFPDPSPHLTVATAPPCADLEAMTSEFDAACAEQLPLRLQASAAFLMLKRAGRWAVRERLPFGAQV